MRYHHRPRLYQHPGPPEPKHPEIEYTPPVHPEIGKALTVKDLRPGQIVWIHKPGCPVASTRVGAITTNFVYFMFCGQHLSARREELIFAALRTPNDAVTDDINSPLYLYQYLGEDKDS